jgi:serine/threonine protein kinase/tetratricopeptide (TPR) repeat protein
MPFSVYVVSLAAAIADGQQVDWAEAEKRAETDDDRLRLRQLRAVAAVTSVHRDWSDPGAVPGDDGSSFPPPDPLPAPAETPIPRSADGDRFLIERLLGKGGYGVVYKAYDRERKAYVAIKSLNHDDAASIYDLKREFRVLADLSHPNLVSLYELFADGDSWFIAMDLVKGVDFLRYVRELAPAGEGAPAAVPPDPQVDGIACNPGRLQQAVVQLAHALCYLHAQKIVHCDIKPSNVLVSADGHLKVLDFGLATDVIPRSVIDTTRVRGTPAYVAPEQAAGQPATAASDWYSVGVILFEALTGERPFNGSFVEVLEAKRHRDAPAASAIRQGIPEPLDTLCRDLLARDPAARPTGTQVLDRLQRFWPSASITREPVVRSEQVPFVGRSAQLALLDRAFDGSTLGRAETVFVHGGSGMGKSSLVRRFLDLLRERESDLVILEGRCYERESVPYKAVDSVVDALSRYLRKLPRPHAEALLPRDVASLTRLFPILRRVEAIAESRHRPIPTTNAQEVRRRGFAAFRELLARLTDRYAVVLVIDDLQWSDADSAALLVDMMFGEEPPPLLFVACYRSGEAPAGTALGSLLTSAAQARREFGCQVHEAAIGELSAEDAWELASELARGHQIAAPLDAIVLESGRSPFFINELIEYSAALGVEASAAVAGAPSLLQAGSTTELTLDSVIRVRTGHLRDGTRRLLQVLALYGAPLDFRTATEAAGLSPGGLEEMAELRTAHLTRTRLTAAGERLELYHDRIREAVVAALDASELQQLHARLAAVLERSEGVEAETLVAHLHGAGQNDSAARYAVIAADRAREAMAFVRAALQYRFALDCGLFDAGRRREIEVKLGDALAASGRGYDAAQVYLSAAANGTAADVLELKRRAAEQLLQSGHIDEGFNVIRDVLSTVRLKLAPTPRRALLSLLIQRARIRLRGLGFRERHRRDVPADALVRVDTCWSVATGLAIVDYIRAAEFQARHLLLALNTGEPYRVVRALAMELAYRSIGGVKTQRQNERLMSVAEPLAARVDNPEAQALVTLVKGSAAYMQGRWRTARDLFERAETVLQERCAGVAWEIDTARFYMALALFYLGELNELARRLPSLLKEARERDALYVETNLRTRIAYVTSLAADDPDQAARDVRRGMERWSQQGFHIQHYYELVATTEIALYTGRGAEALDGVERCWKDLRRSFLLGVQPVRIEALFLRARAALAAAIDSSGADRRRGSLVASARRDAARLARERATWAMALSELVLSGVATLEQRTGDAAGSLRRAEQLFQESDMRLHAAVTRRRLGELGDPAAGAAMIADADDWLRHQGIRNGAQFVAMLAPTPRVADV